MRCNITQTAMQSFLSIAPELGINDLPKDWRTVMKYSIQGSDAGLSEVWKTTEVCGHCFLISFLETDLQNLPRCDDCGISRITCSLCDYRCIVASSIGNRSRKLLTNCYVCGANADVDVTVRSYLFDIKTQLRSMFSRKSDCEALLSPFRSSDMQFYNLRPVQTPSTSSTFNLDTDNGSYGPTQHVFECSKNWEEDWPLHCASSKYFKELWHGKRFYESSLFREHGMRSVLYELGLDWFPPHKEKQNYSVGVISACPANLPMELRSDLRYMFVLGVIEGPHEPKHVLKLLQPLFENFQSLDENGVVVFDALTQTDIKVHATLGLCVCDSPAASRLGAFVFPGRAFMPCIRCCYKGRICGHTDPIDDPSQITIWDNEAVRNPTRSVREPPVLFAGDSKRKIMKVEHVSFTEFNVICEDQLRLDVHVRADQVQMGNLLFDKGHTKASERAVARELRVNGVSPLILISSKRFSIVLDFGMDALHTLLKGIALKMLELTFDKRYKKMTFNIHYHKKSGSIFRNRVRRLKFQEREDPPTRLHKSAGGLKAAQIWLFCKVMALATLRQIIPHCVYSLWTKLTTIVSGILHTHVSKRWVLSEESNGLAEQIRSFYQDYLECYGLCHMPFNFHWFLHCRLDCINWSSLRSHSAFKFERLNHELMVAPRSNAETKITQSMVRVVCELGIRLNARSTEQTHHVRSKWPTSLPPAESIPALSALRGKSFVSKRGTDQFSNVWDVGDYITAIDHSTGESAFLCGSIIAQIATFLNVYDEVWALLYPVRVSIANRYRINGAYQIGAQDVSYDTESFRLLCLSRVPEDIHICAVCSFRTDDGTTLHLPLCGPLPF